MKSVRLQASKLFFLAFLLSFGSVANSQIDAGALQQGLEKQLPMPSH
uniref:Uncharacterized protein n=1 Tax=Polynucleobacter necessarius subsp. necessarius (strain STIR1) TaxID=452638 RepID=B1XUG0_POLNS